MNYKICKVCKSELPATNEYFHVHNGCKDGLNTTCKECRSKISAARIRGNINSENKKCIDCGRVLSLVNFNKKVNSTDGHYNICKECQIKRRRKDCKDGYKKCNKCKRELPATRDFFMSQKSNLDGFTGICLECLGRIFYPNKASESWSESDIQIVKDNYLDLTIKEIIPLLSINRTEKAILHMAKKLGLKKVDLYESINDDEKYKTIDGVVHKLCKSCRRYLPLEFLYFPRDIHCTDGYRNVCKECKGENFRLQQVFTPEEEEIINKYYYIKTNREIQKEFMPDKTIEQINHKASALGLKKKPEIILKAKEECRTLEWRMKISQTKKERGVHSGKLNPMYGSHRVGELNPNWKNGISSLYNFLRRNIKQWKIDSIKNCNYKEVLTGGRFNHVHHLYAFELIVEETMNELGFPIYHKLENYTLEELKQIEQKCLEIHYRYPFGVCLSKNNHLLFHNIYGFGKNTPEQFEEFKIDFLNGKFNEVNFGVI